MHFTTQVEAGKYFSNSKGSDNVIRTALKNKGLGYGKVWKYKSSTYDIISFTIDRVNKLNGGRFRKGENCWKGRKHSEKTVEGFRNRIISEETRKRMSESAKKRGSNRTKNKLQFI